MDMEPIKLFYDFKLFYVSLQIALCNILKAELFSALIYLTNMNLYVREQSRILDLSPKVIFALYPSIL